MVLGLWLGGALATHGETPARWTRFRGPNGSGLSDATTIPVSFTTEDFNWMIELPGEGHSSPVIWEDKIFLTTVGGRPRSRQIVCLDVSDGHLRWAWRDPRFEEYGQHRDNSFASSTPTVDGERVYVVWTSGFRVIALALDHEGRLVWQRDLGNYSDEWGSAASPILVDDLLIFGNYQLTKGGFLTGLDIRNGATAWRLPRIYTYKASYSTPVVFQSHSGDANQVVFVSPSGGVTSVDAATGHLLWEKRGLFNRRTVASPIIADGLIIAMSGSDMSEKRLAAIRPGGTVSGQEAQVVYTVSARAHGVPTPVAYDHLMFLWHNNGIVSCLETRTGEELWKRRLGEGYYASPVCIDGKIYNISREGTLVVLEAAPEFKLLAENKMPEGSHASLAVAGGRLYVRTYHHLISVGGD